MKKNGWVIAAITVAAIAGAVLVLALAGIIGMAVYCIVVAVIWGARGDRRERDRGNADRIKQALEERAERQRRGEL